ncbi:MAG: mechanosensitive ion channel [Spirochaetales bacterium]|nr:mechanosensitive ion channel [Spirochaetales bacterium]
MADFFDTLLKISLTTGKFSLFPFGILFFVILPVFGIFILRNIILSLFKKMIFSRNKAKTPAAEKLVRYIKWILRVMLMIGISITIYLYFGDEIPIYITNLWDAIKTPIFTTGSTQISFVTLLLAIPVIFAASWIARHTKNIFETKILSKVKADKSIKFTISRLIRYGSLILIIIIGLTVIGIDLSAITVLLGVLGIGIGFGLQSLVANVFAGIVILFERPVKEGDRISVNGIEGNVVRIKLRSTIINTLTNETIIIPNSQLVDHHVHNYSFHTPDIVIKNIVAVSYSTDLEKACEVLIAIAERNPFKKPDTVPKARVMEFADSGIVMHLFTWIIDTQEKMDALAWTNMEIWRDFKKNNINIPFPQMDVHLKKE